MEYYLVKDLMLIQLLVLTLQTFLIEGKGIRTGIEEVRSAIWPTWLLTFKFMMPFNSIEFFMADRIDTILNWIITIFHNAGILQLHHKNKLERKAERENNSEERDALDGAQMQLE